MKEHKQIDTSANAKMDKPQFPEDRKEPSLPVFIPMRIVRWLAYSLCFACLLIPMSTNLWHWVNGGLILGHFASQLNALINKK